MNGGKVIFYGSIVAFLTGVGFGIKFLLDRKKGTGSGESNENYNSLVSNLGGVGTPASGGINVYFNDKKNNAVFYPNNRIVIFQGKNQVAKGSYSDGGKTIVLDSGKIASDPSVFKNLNSLIINI